MCIIICGFGSALPTRAQLEYSCINNQDGFGWGVVLTDSSILVGKSMTAKTAIDEYLTCVASNQDNVAASGFWARIATHGAMDLTNCQPFTVGDGSGSVMFHNGILPLYADKSETRSDSRCFAEEILPQLGGVAALGSQGVWDVVSAFAEGSKLVFLNPDPENPLTIVNEKLGHWVGDVWYSNHSYQPYTSVYTSAVTYKTEADLDDVDIALETNSCFYCYRQLVLGVCNACGWCWDCDEASNACLCWSDTISVDINEAAGWEAF